MGCRRGGDIHHLVDEGVELFRTKRAVLEGGGQAEAEFDEAFLAGAVAVIHSADLGD